MIVEPIYIVFRTPTSIFNQIHPTDKKYIDELIKTLPKDTLYYKVLDGEKDFPNKDDDFYKAWEFTPSLTVEVNMPAARNIIREKLRPLRDAKFAPLDVAFMRAVERGDTAKQQEIAAEKQKLRDITVHPAIDAATTLDELRDLTVDKLLSMTT